MVEWLGLHAFTAKGLISGQGTKIPKVTQLRLKKRKNKPLKVKRKVTKWEKVSAMCILTKNLYPEYTNTLQINKKGQISQISEYTESFEQGPSKRRFQIGNK